MDELNVKVGSFEGPLELLLHLIKKLEIDIYDIPMTLITEQYLQYMKQLPKEDWDQTSKYMVMAATLLAIKSKMLLPIEQQEEQEDPRKELVEQLLTYQQYQEAAEWLDEKQEGKYGCFSHDSYNLEPYQKEVQLEMGKYQAQQLYQAIAHLQLRAKTEGKAQEKFIWKDHWTIGGQMRWLEEQLRHHSSFSLQKSWQGKPSLYKVTTFSALLELVKRDEMVAIQEKNFGEIIIRGRECE